MKYRKKPVVIEAIQWTDSSEAEKVLELTEFFGNMKNWWYADIDCVPVLKIQTLEGIMIADIGDYIIKGIKGEYYPCKPDIFERTYELCEDEDRNHR